MSAEPRPHPPSWRLEDEGSLRCEVVPERDVVYVRPIGSLDLATVAVLEQQLKELREAGFRRLIVDLGGLLFMDSTGCISRSNGTPPRSRMDSRSALHRGHRPFGGSSS
jgi:STAS domain